MSFKLDNEGILGEGFLSLLAQLGFNCLQFTIEVSLHLSEGGDLSKEGLDGLLVLGDLGLQLLLQGLESTDDILQAIVLLLEISIDTLQICK